MNDTTPTETERPVNDTTPTEAVATEAVATEAGPVEAVREPTEAEEMETGRPAETAHFRMAVVTAVAVDLPNQHPTVVLQEIESPQRQLSFSVALQDGVVLSQAIRRIGTPRPLTHELLTGILHGFDIDVVAVRLVGRQGAVVFAELDLRGRTGRSVHACRPSDALTIALLQPVPAPVLIDRRLLEQAGDVTPG